MAIQIIVRYSGPEPGATPLDAYALKIEVTSATGVSNKIFVFQRIVPSPTDPTLDTLGDKFVSVADPVDLEQYPADAPDLAHDVPYYRTHAVTLLFRSIAELDEVRRFVDADVRKLVEALKMVAVLPAQEEVQYE